MSYARRANAVVIVEWIFFALAVIGLIVVTRVNYDEFVEAFHKSYGSVRTTAIIYAVVVPIGLLTGFILNILLSTGVHNGHSTPLKIWYIISIILTGLIVIESIISFIAGFLMVRDISIGSLDLVILLIYVLIRVVVLSYKIWSIRVIIEFRNELTTSSSGFNGGGVVYSFSAATTKP